MARGEFSTVEEVAERLHTSTRRVRQLLEDGSLLRVARGLVDTASVDRHLASGHSGRTRVWAERTAWAAISVLSGFDATWLGQPQASRLLSTLRRIEVDELIIRLRDRAVARTFTGHRSAARALRGQNDLVAVESRSLGLVADDSNLDAYLHRASLSVIIHRYGLREDTTGTITLRITAFDLEVVRRLAAHGTVLAALDAATSLDPRERGAGRRRLAVALEGLRR